MIQLHRITDLAMFRNLKGWETSVAQSDATVMYAANSARPGENAWAAYSLDNGQTFSRIDAASMTDGLGETLCCDQVIIYVPPIQRFVWALQTLMTTSGENSILIAVASPSDVSTSKGTAWVRYRITARATFKRPGCWLDHPRLSYGDKYLYFTCLLVDATGQILGSVIARFDLSQMKGPQPLNPLDNFRPLQGDFAIVEQGYVAPVRRVGHRGYFAGITPDWSSIRIWLWNEGAGERPWFRDVPIETIPTQDFASLTPDGRDWIGDTTGETIKWSPKVTSAVRRGDELWVAWQAARRVHNQTQNTFPHPHIGLAVIHANLLTLLDLRYIWHPDYAYTYPTLDGNGRDVAMTYCSGGGPRYVQHGVGFVSDPIELRTTITHLTSYGGGGHFLGIQPAFPTESCFVASCHIGVIEKGPNQPTPAKDTRTYFVRFSRANVRCGRADLFSELPGGLRRLVVGLVEFAQTTLQWR